MLVMTSWQQIDGWLTESEGLALRDLAAGKHVLEIGSLFGRSTVCMAEVATQVVSVDPHLGQAIEGTRWENQSTLEDFFNNLSAHGVCHKVVPVVAPIETASPLLNSMFDLVFVDGDHSHEACLRDCEIAWRLLDLNGTIAVHDYGTGYRHLAGVTSAVNQFRRDHACAIRRVNSLAILDRFL